MDVRSKFKSLKMLTFANSRTILVLLYFFQLFIREEKGGREKQREEGRQEGKEEGRNGDIVG